MFRKPRPEPSCGRFEKTHRKFLLLREIIGLQIDPKSKLSGQWYIYANSQTQALIKRLEDHLISLKKIKFSSFCNDMEPRKSPYCVKILIKLKQITLQALFNDFSERDTQSNHVS